MAFDDLRDWIDHLRREGELVEVTAEVDPHLEIAEITDRVTKAGGPALLFTNVRGSRMPLEGAKTITRGDTHLDH